ncbi:phenylacetate-CoA oxygenase subunit PaaC [Micromonospora sonneratiae]|uniref:1,2-phenylacetyl-CoA epoxidase subunit PaaC n=1 Tax=Micromonospora sonneratiae TaxID=1184706 RepID=A0ABW3YGU0_9ACTN
MNELTEFLLRTGDDALVAAQRLGEWVAAAPEMEEDIALANIALDQLGAARLLLSYAGELMTGSGQRPAGAVDGEVTEDTLAYLRDDREFRNCLLVELPNGDFAVTMAKLLFLSAYQRLLYDRLVASTDGRLASIAAKARKEVAYHLDHAQLWTLRLGDGTAESHRRMQAAVDQLWPYTHELFQADEPTRRLDEAGVVAAPDTLREAWLGLVEPVLAQATLDRPADAWAPVGGRAGLHTEHLSYLLAEMQVLHRAHPGARW